MTENVALRELDEVYERVLSAAKRSGRDQSQIKIIAVSKAQSNEKIETFLDSKKNYWALGESYLNEMIEKQKHFAAQNLEWHFLGRLQSRKIPELCAASSVLHSVSRFKELEILLLGFQTQKFYLQINVSGESSKAGISPGELSGIMGDENSSKNNVESKLRAHLLGASCLGLMCMPSPIDEVSEEKLRSELATLRELRDRFLPGKELNMGTSNDFEIAIEEGAQVIRLGSCLFGERDYQR